MSTTDEQQELAALRNLDPQVISTVYDRHFPDVYRYAFYRISDPTTAEDIASDVFKRLLESIHAGRAPRTNLKAWLLATASHVVNDHLRRVYRRPTDALPETLADATDLATDFDQRERERHLKESLATLTEEQQHVLNLRFNQGYSLEETAALLKKNVNAIKQLQFRALAALNRKLGGAA